MKKTRKWIIYRGVDRVFVTTPKCEASFRKQAAAWHYNLDEDFNREVVTDSCILVEATLAVS